MNRHIVVNAPDVLHEVFDDEVVLINMSSGVYYSIVNTAAWVWRQIAGGCDLGDLVARASDTFEGRPEDLETALSGFLEELHTEGLIKYVESSGRPTPSASATANVEKVQFDAPVIERYADMQELLLLDPIHEVNDVGWPAALPDKTNSDE